MKSSFQTILAIVFMGAFIFAVLVFAGVIKLGQTEQSTELTGSVTIWSPFKQEAVQAIIDNFNFANPNLQVRYVQKSEAAINEELVRALADGMAPDLVVLSNESYISYRDKLFTVLYQNYSERAFKDTYVDGSSLFLNKEGINLFPLIIDPVVIYYNKDLLAGARYVVPPKTWSELNDSVLKLVKRDDRGGITQSPIALGESTNINNLKEIISAFLLQTGSPIVQVDQVTGQVNIVIETGGSYEASPQAQALTYYTSFANPTNSLYSWNKSLPDSLDTFLAGKSAFYIGKASELFTIQEQNPNLNFDVAELFQPDQAVRPITYGTFYAVGIMKSSQNFTGAYGIASLLTTKEANDYLSKQLSLPSARRDLLSVPPENPYVAVFFRAAASSFSWLDPNPEGTAVVFRDMIRNINSGAQSPQAAIYEATRSLQTLVR